MNAACAAVVVSDQAEHITAADTRSAQETPADGGSDEPARSGRIRREGLTRAQRLFEPRREADNCP